MANKILPYNPDLKILARELRKNGTLSEILLWNQLKRKKFGFEFHRQVPIKNFIVDFYSHELMLAIEVDGSSHDSENQLILDEKRQQEIEQLGVRFIRIDDLEVKTNLDGVIQYISAQIDEYYK
ncbi:MAG TPA: DNA methylase [Balneolaceae bacterium]|nr:DNA methylase [Balneolaceae bacterium]|tara:strand:+ start:7120 stop:7491 length:372 start_codon:yes stop_codon:yes gene_type:complete